MKYRWKFCARITMQWVFGCCGSSDDKLKSFGLDDKTKKLLSGTFWDYAESNYSRFIVNKLKFFVNNISMNFWYGQKLKTNQVQLVNGKSVNLTEENYSKLKETIQDYMFIPIQRENDELQQICMWHQTDEALVETAPSLDLSKSPNMKKFNVRKGLCLKRYIYPRCKGCEYIYNKKYWKDKNNTFWKLLENCDAKYAAKDWYNIWLGPVVDYKEATGTNANPLVIDLSCNVWTYVYGTFSGRHVHAFV